MTAWTAARRCKAGEHGFLIRVWTGRVSREPYARCEIRVVYNLPFYELTPIGSQLCSWSRYASPLRSSRCRGQRCPSSNHPSPDPFSAMQTVLSRTYRDAAARHRPRLSRARVERLGSLVLRQAPRGRVGHDLSFDSASGAVPTAAESSTKRERGTCRL